MRILEAVEAVNEEQKSILFRKLDDYFKGDLKGKRIAMWGLASSRKPTICAKPLLWS